AVRRPGAAAVHRLRAGAQSGGSVPGRADRGARPAGPPEPVGHAAGDQRRGPHRGADHASHGRGRAALRAGRHHGPRQDPADRPARLADQGTRLPQPDHGQLRAGRPGRGPGRAARHGGHRRRGHAGRHRAGPGPGALLAVRARRAGRSCGPRRHAGGRVPEADRTGVPRVNAYRSLARAMLRGFLRDRGSLIFTVALPVLFLVLLGSIYKGSSAPQVKVAEIGRVPLLDQAVRSGQLRTGLKVSHASSPQEALQQVRQGDLDGAVSQQGSHLVLHYSIADQVTSGVVRALFSSLVQSASQEATGKPPAFTLATTQVEDRSLKPIQYLAPGLLGWAIASGATFGAAITPVHWRTKKLRRRLRLTPASTGAISAARITVSLLIALVQMAAFLLIATTPYFGLKLTHWWWMAIPIVIAGTLAFLSLGLL